MELVPLDSLYINEYILKDVAEISSGVYCEKGDILLAKITPSFENGKQGIVEGIPLDFAYATTEVYPLKPTQKLVKLFLFYYLAKSSVRSNIASKMQGTTGRKRVPQEAIENTLIPIPPISEQKEIANILLNADKKIETEQKRQLLLQQLFKTMLQKLMTGEIRVKNLDLGVYDVN